MKKALSILLSVMMVAGLFVALIPATSAFESPTPIPEVTKGELIYEEKFDNVDSSLTNDELAAALNWTDRTVSMAIVGDYDVEPVTDSEDIYGYFSDWQKNGNNRLQISAGAGTGGPTIVVDDRLAGGDYILEYTAIMIDNTSGDGQGLGFSSGGFPLTATSPSASLSTGTIWKTAAKERGQFDIHVYVNGSSKSITTTPGASADYDTSTKACIKNFQSNSESTGAGSICNQEIRYRIVVDADFGYSVWTYDNEAADWVVWGCMKGDETSIQTWQKAAPYIGNSIMMRLLAGPTILVDDIQVWAIDKTNYEKSELALDDIGFVYPNEDGSELSDNALVITAVNTDALPSTTNYDVIIGHPNPDQTKYVDAEGNPVGAVELNEDGSYKYGQDGVNDQLRFEYVEVYNASNVTKNIYDYALGLFNSCDTKYMTYATSAGKLDAIHPGKNTVTSTNNTWGYTYVNPDYADGAIAPGESAVIMIPNNWWNADCTNGTNESFRRVYLEQILGYTTQQADAVKVFTYAPQGGAGINNTTAALITLVPLVDGEVPTEYAEGLALDYTYIESYVVADIDKNEQIVFNPCANGDHSTITDGFASVKYYAANYDHWTDDGKYVPAGILSANSNTLETTTPGTVPAELKKPVVEGAKNALWTGWQAAADGSIRLVAEIADTADVKSIGFEITIPDAEVTKTVYVNYVYNKLTTNFGEDNLGFKYGSSNYFVALAITGVIDVAPIDFQVKVVTVYTDGTVDTTGAVAFTAAFEA